MNPYAYVGGNPETYSDPTGQMVILPGEGGGGELSTIILVLRDSSSFLSAFCPGISHNLYVIVLSAESGNMFGNGRFTSGCSGLQSPLYPFADRSANGSAYCGGQNA